MGKRKKTAMEGLQALFGDKEPQRTHGNARFVGECYEIQIKSLAAPIFSKDYFGTHSEVEYRKTVADVKKFLDEKYGNSRKHRRKPMYVDLKDGKTIQTGFVIGYREDGMNRQDWVEICLLRQFEAFNQSGRLL
jgi:hypothetical protein